MITHLMLKIEKSPYNAQEQIRAVYFVFLKSLREISLEKLSENSMYLLFAALFQKETQIRKFDFSLEVI